MKRISIQTDLEIDPQFWALLPALNINWHSKKFEFEWFCLMVYIGKMKPEVKKNILEYEIHVNVKPALKAIRKLRKKLLWLKIKMFFKRPFKHSV
jgi:hypothetical protein